MHPITTTPALLPSLHFCAPTPQGSLHLALPARHGSDAVGAALALADAEPLLAELEQWLALPLDPCWMHAEAAPAAPAPAPTGLLWCGSADEARLGLPWALLAQAAPPGIAALADVQLELQVEVARWPHLPPAPAVPPVPPGSSAGALLLLPASHQSSWRVTLVQRALGMEVDAHWPGPGHAPSAAGAPRVAAPAEACVRLDQVLRWPVRAVFGWSPAPATPLDDGAQAWQAGAGQAAFSGRIVPALGGAGLWVPAAAETSQPVVHTVPLAAEPTAAAA
jgi:hypothetical protein